MIKNRPIGFNNTPPNIGEYNDITFPNGERYVMLEDGKMISTSIFEYKCSRNNTGTLNVYMHTTGRILSHRSPLLTMDGGIKIVEIITNTGGSGGDFTIDLRDLDNSQTSILSVIHLSANDFMLHKIDTILPPNLRIGVHVNSSTNINRPSCIIRYHKIKQV